MPKSSANNQWYYRRGDLANGKWDVHVDANNPPIKGWEYTGIRVGTLGAGIELELPSDNNERIIFALEGDGFEVAYKTIDSHEFKTQKLGGRKSVFHGPTDLIYLPLNTVAKITGTGRVAVGECPAKNQKPVKFIPKDSVPVGIRGCGRESRQVHNFGMPDTLDADRMIAVEVIVPAGNWSGTPAHKHDVYVPGKESHLEEIYYFESAVGRGLNSTGLTKPFGYFRGYASDEREYDVIEEIFPGDLSLVPHGWHGPVAAGPGYDLYFFNVMAGPDPDRIWNVTDHPDQAWLRQAWNSQEADPRLPYRE